MKTISVKSILPAVTGEEFCIILPDTDRGGAFLCGGRIRSAIEATIKAYDVTVNVTISIGLAIYRRTGRKRPS